ncbi:MULTISPECIES: serine/threonine-protein kinase [Nostocales]|uniref:Protein kinase n=1 Tax=Dolichospermum flos-aquae UHCC 0037 TaxID=2590026 RepID=A0ACC7S9S0_DOLFA|nr:MULTISPECIES: serine/threonine-protein kinase [Nostocales]MBO1064307.1 protein kinase [Anabaena sp. 54]MCX5983405.1 serine/threonine protein kinase [Nostocales cyanobacterium LacPavin_0920_SED1_MAG_38_18]MTJ45205.1 protein kinase [Dolichospermum flos-aquae UHCC 0037]OBQ23234.1 MAG: serine/threonine protein kinase [Anabaena sp. AL93]
MICCLNPDCSNPQNPDHHQLCQTCHTPLVPLLRNRFRVLRVLSDEGGFGRTYISEDIDKLNELCVVKQLAPKFQGTWSQKKATQLFSEEARRLQELGEHPQIPTLIAYFQQDNCLYLVQQFIDGQNLFNELKSRRIYKDWDIQSILLDLLPIIKFVHQHGVIHRDIKPENIIRRKTDGRLTLIDFGSSKQLTAQVQRKNGTSIGSHGYSPIEQIRDGKAYPASDLFSLGATCFHLLTGISPFQLWMEYGYAWVENWQQYLRFPLSSDLSEIIDKLLQKEIDSRYQSADEVIRDLMKKHNHILPAAKHKIIKSPRKNSQPHSSKYTWVRNLIFIFGIVVSFALVESGYREFRKLKTNFSFSWSQPRNSPPTFATSEKNLSLVNTFSGHKSKVLSVVMSPNDKLIISAGDCEKSNNSLCHNIKLWDIITGKEIASLQGHSQNVNAVAITPNGKALVSASDDKTIKIWNLQTNQLIHTLKSHTDAIHSLAISSNGKILVSASDDKTIKVWNLITGKLIRTLIGHKYWVRSVDISPDGVTLASGSFDKTIKLWNLNQEAPILNLATSSQTVIAVAFSPNGKILASSSRDSVSADRRYRTIKLWNLQTLKEIRTLMVEDNSVNTIAFSPDGKILASAGRNISEEQIYHTIKLWNVATGEEILTLTGHSNAVTSLAFSADGKFLVSGGEDNLIKIWQIPVNDDKNFPRRVLVLDKNKFR